MSVRVIAKCTVVCLLTGALAACQQSTPTQLSEQSAEQTEQVSIPYEKYTLNNGLTVILHEDHSDPLVHVDVTYHVGSAREETGKSGFAHFFEHMMFQGSEHVADEQHFKIITEAGGDLNGSTNTDRTNYYETVPANQLEKVLWLEADRMGFLLPAVDQTKFENQRETVKNERAQRVDNQPYGLSAERTAEALYPVGHPYSWMPIGYVEDLDRVNVDDLKAFFQRWYGPNNAVLTIGGDINVARTKQWIKKYFATIPRGPEVIDPEPQPVSLEDDRFITLEDNVHLPLLQITFPTIYARHEDEAPLDVLADILGGGKTSLLYKNLVKGGQAVQASVGHPCRELACEFQIMALSNPATGNDLADLNKAVRQTFNEFEQRGVTADDLARTKASIESSTVFGLQSVAGKVSTLAAGETFQHQPDLVADDIRRYNAVTAEDVMRVYRKYIKNGHGVFLSVVPKGQKQLAVKPQNFTLPKRQIPPRQASEAVEQASIHDDFDRNQVPQAGPTPIVEVPEYWQAVLPGDISLLGVTSAETPTVTFTLSMEGGMLLDPQGKAGTAYLTSLMMNEATEHYSNEEMANALAKLGSSVRFNSRGRYTQIYVSTLTKNLTPTLALLKEKLFHPAFNPQDFERMKERVMQSMQQQLKKPSALASRVKDAILFGLDNRVALPDEGTLATISKVTLKDVKAFYEHYYNPAQATAVVVSDLPRDKILQSFGFLKDWQAQDYTVAPYKPFPEYSESSVYLVDSPGAVQSVVYLVRRANEYDATGEYFRSRLMNFPLGGAFNSRINLNLREDKGYTYGASSAFVGGKTLGWFEANADLNAANTGDGIKELINEITHYQQQGITDEELLFMRNAYTLSDALDYETPGSKARFLSQLQVYQLPDDYRAKQLDIIRHITAGEINALAAKELDVKNMQIIVVGDKQKILEQLTPLNLPVTELSLQDGSRKMLTE